MGFTHSPKFPKGAFVQIDNNSPVQKIIEFQYNPEKIDRRIQVHENPKRRWFYRNRNEPATSEATPREFLTFNLLLDASDASENPQDKMNTIENGIYSKLSAIEMLIYPQMHRSGNKNFMGIAAPGSGKNQSLILFVWGNKRILPVSIVELHIVEEMFDTSLNPVRATIAITMCVLNDIDLQHNKKGLEYWKTHLNILSSLADKGYKKTNLKDLKST